MLRARATLFLAVRLAVRINQALPPTGAGAPGAGLWRAALPAFVASDLLVWHLLRNSERFGLAWRLPIDMAEVGFWSLSPLPTTGHYEMVLLGTMPLAIEAGFRIGLGGLVIPAAELVTATITRSLAARPVSPASFTWLILGVGIGMALWTYCERLYESAESAHGQILAADRYRAYLGGQNHVAMGASSAVDMIQGLSPIIGAPPPDSALWRLDTGWKAQLGVSTAQEAWYLQSALLQWEKRHNQHPDLAGHVALGFSEGDGTTILTAAQVGHLWSSLDGLGLRGFVRVELDLRGTGRRLPGTSVRVLVDGAAIDVPADRRSAPRPVEPGPIAFVLAAADVLIASGPGFGSVSWPAIGFGVALCVGAACWAHRQLAKLGIAATRQVFGAAVVVALLMAAPLTLAVRQPLNADGGPAYPFRSGVLLLTFLGGLYFTPLRGHRLALPTAVVAVYAIGLALAPARTLASVVSSLAWTLPPYPICRHASSTLASAAAKHARMTMAVDVEAVRREFLNGQESVVSLVRQAHSEAADRLRRVRSTTDPAVAAVVIQRLDSVDRRLQVLDLEQSAQGS